MLETSGVVSAGPPEISAGIDVVLGEGVLVDSWSGISVGKVEEPSSEVDVWLEDSSLVDSGVDVDVPEERMGETHSIVFVWLGEAVFEDS